MSACPIYELPATALVGWALAVRYVVAAVLWLVTPLFSAAAVVAWAALNLFTEPVAESLPLMWFILVGAAGVNRALVAARFALLAAAAAGAGLLMLDVSCWARATVAAVGTVAAVADSL
jgi:hypothetical protein